MGRHITGTMAIAVLLTACQVTPATRADLPAKGASPAPGKARTTASAAPADGAAPAMLQAPGAASVTLSGQVALDGEYATRFGGAAKLVGADGASLVGMDGASLVGADGASLMAGGRMVAAPGGNVAVPAALIGMDGATLIGMDGGTLIGADGATLIGADGASLVGADGASLVAAGAGNLVAAGAGNYALLQAPPAAAMPAAGMWVSVVDMRTGFTVPLGMANGREVHTIYTDAAGRFTVHVDPAIAGDVRIVARAPGRRDPRLALTVIADASKPAQRVDEREALVTGFLRTILGLRLVDLFAIDATRAATKADEIEKTGQTINATEQMLQVLGGDSMRAMGAALEKIGARKTGPDALSAERRQEIALLMADRLLAEMTTEALTVSVGAYQPLDPAAEALDGKPLLGEIRALFEDVIAAAERRLAKEADPEAWLASRPWLIAANLKKPPAERYRLARAVDVAEFMVREYLASNESEQTQKASLMLHDLEAPLIARDRIRLTGESFMVGMLTTLVAAAGQSGRPTSELVAAAIETTGARIAKAPPRPLVTYAGRGDVAVPTPPPAPAYADVETIAGTPGQRGGADGLGAAARFSKPTNLIAAPGAEPGVYVADGENNAIREIRFDAAGQAVVTTIAGTAGTTGLLDGAGAAARFAVPHALAFDAQGRLYVADQFNHAIRRLTKGADGVWVTETLAGGNGEGFADGPAAEAKFHLPRGVAVDAAGDVYVADTFNHRIRRIRAGQVSTIAGTGPVGALLESAHGKVTSGAAGQVHLTEPSSVAFAPDGSLYVAQQSPGAIRRIQAPLGTGSEVSLLAGLGASNLDPLDGFYTGCFFDYLQTIATDPQGRLVAADVGNHRIRLITPDGWVSTLAGSGPTGVPPGFHADGPPATAGFGGPWGVAVAADGTIYVADTNNSVIRRLRRR